MNNQKYDVLKLENQLCFPLYAAAKETVKLYRPLLEKLNLTYTQYIAMMVFWEHRKMNVKELGERLYLDSGTLTPVLKSLEAKGYVRRYRSTEDERVLPVPGQMACHLVLSPEESQTLYQLLYKMLSGIEEQ